MKAAVTLATAVVMAGMLVSTFSSPGNADSGYLTSAPNTAMFALTPSQPTLPLALNIECFGGMTVTLALVPSGTNMAAWTGFNGPATSAAINAFFPAPCGGGVPIPILQQGDTISLNNSRSSTLLSAVHCAICMLGMPTFLVPVVEAGPCGGPVTSTAEVTAFASVVVDSFVFSNGMAGGCDNTRAVTALNLQAVLAPPMPTNTPTQMQTEIPTQTPTASSQATPTIPTNTPTSVVSATPTAVPSPLPCAGDCDGNGTVTADELLTLVNIALGSLQASACNAGDANRDFHIAIADIVAAVNNALNGCPGVVFLRGATPARTASPQADMQIAIHVGTATTGLSTATPTPIPARTPPATGEESIDPRDVRFPGCETVMSESHYCLTTSHGDIAVVGLDTGKVCAVTRTTGLGSANDSHSIAWHGEILYACGDRGLVGVSLRNGTWDTAAVPCRAVTIYRNRLLVTTAERVAFPTYTPGIDAERMTVGAGIFYGALASTGVIERFDLNAGQRLPSLRLEGFDDRIYGLAVTDDGHLVLGGGSGAALLIFDVTTGHKVRELHPVKPVIGLSCVRGTGIRE